MTDVQIRCVRIANREREAELERRIVDASKDAAEAQADADMAHAQNTKIIIGSVFGSIGVAAAAFLGGLLYGLHHH